MAVYFNTFLAVVAVPLFFLLFLSFQATAAASMFVEFFLM